MQSTQNYWLQTNKYAAPKHRTSLNRVPNEAFFKKASRDQSKIELFAATLLRATVTEIRVAISAKITKKKASKLHFPDYREIEGELNYEKDYFVKLF